MKTKVELSNVKKVNTEINNALQTLHFRFKWGNKSV